MTGEDANDSIFTERVVHGVVSDGLCLENKRTEGCSQRSGFFSQVFGSSLDPKLWNY